jgi:SlyX protein
MGAVAFVTSASAEVCIYRTEASMSDAEFREAIELKIAFLERANTELSDVVYRQQQELTAVRQQLLLLADRFEAMKLETEAYSPAHEKPPHY